MELRDVVQEAVQKCEPPTRYRLAIRIGVSPTSVYSWEKPGANCEGKHVLAMLSLAQEHRQTGFATLGIMLTLFTLTMVPPIAERVGSMYIMLNRLLRKNAAIAA